MALQIVLTPQEVKLIELFSVKGRALLNYFKVFKIN